MQPTHQRFRTLQLTEVVHLWLQVEHKLTLGHATAHVMLQLQSLADHLLHQRVIKTQGVFTRRLGVVHRQVGALHQLIYAVRFIVEQHHAEAGGVEQIMLTDPIRLTQREHELTADMLHLSSSFLRLRLQPFKHDDKLVTPQTGHGVQFAQGIFQALRHLTQQLIAGLVPIQVVDVFEVVQIKEDQGAEMAIAPAQGSGLLQAVTQQATVGQAGQRVIKRQELDFLFGVLAFTDIGQ